MSGYNIVKSCVIALTIIHIDLGYRYYVYDYTKYEVNQ